MVNTMRVVEQKADWWGDGAAGEVNPENQIGGDDQIETDRGRPRCSRWPGSPEKTWQGQLHGADAEH